MAQSSQNLRGRLTILVVESILLMTTGIVNEQPRDLLNAYFDYP